MEPESRNDDQRIVGSAEPLNAGDTRKRLQELEAWGVDMSLIRVSLNRTPTERVTRMIGLLKLAKDLRQAYVAKKAQLDLHDKVQEHHA